MNFNKHLELAGLHAFLSPSSYHWIRYDDEKLDARYISSVAARRGTELHQLAHDLIRLGIKLPTKRNAFNAYVNDSLGYKMTPEQTLYFSPNCFGTADSICFSARQNKLRIFDLKTGVSKASVEQLLVYSALFCLEYLFKPFEIEYDLRIYQDDEEGNEVQMFEVDPTDIAHIMDKIITFDKRINEMRMEEAS